MPTVKLFFFQEAILNPRLPYIACPRQRGRLLIGKPQHCIKITQTNISLHKIYSMPHKPVLAPQIESILFYSPLSFFFFCCFPAKQSNSTIIKCSIIDPYVEFYSILCRTTENESFKQEKTKVKRVRNNIITNIVRDFFKGFIS